MAVLDHDAFFFGAADEHATGDVLALDNGRVAFRTLLDGQPVVLAVALAAVDDGSLVGSIPQNATDGRMEPIAAPGRLDASVVQPGGNAPHSPAVLHELLEDVPDDAHQFRAAGNELDLVALDLVRVGRADAALVLDRRKGFEQVPLEVVFRDRLIRQRDVAILRLPVRTVRHPIHAVGRGSAGPPAPLGQGASGPHPVFREVDAVVVGLLALDDRLDEVRDVAPAADLVGDRVELVTGSLDLDEVRENLLRVVEAAKAGEFVDQDRDEVGVVSDGVGMIPDVAENSQ
ncbi:MAG TPA: hypothetical protein VNM14_12230 [Planctomycetota bacterium]|nr:hypothetical protein [Planctomycetota bacterium]